MFLAEKCSFKYRRDTCENTRPIKEYILFQFLKIYISARDYLIMTLNILFMQRIR